MCVGEQRRNIDLLEVLGLISLRDSLHDGSMGYSRHENHHHDTHQDAANHRQKVHSGGSRIAAGQRSRVFADLAEVYLDHQIGCERQAGHQKA